MILIPLGIGFVGLFLTLFGDRTKSLFYAVSSVIFMCIMVPSFSPDQATTLTALFSCIAILLLGLMRSSTALARSRIPWSMLVFILWATLVGATNNASSGRLSLTLIEATMYILLTLAAAALPSGRSVFLTVLPIAILVEFFIAAGEQFFGLKALWPRVDGSDDISSRYNALAPFLVGRSMGTTSYGIPLGILAGLTLVCCVWLLFTRKKAIYIVFAGLAGLTMLFSGTRTSFLAAGVCAIAWLLGSMTVKRLGWYVPVLVGLSGALLLSNPLELVGLSDIGSTQSYQHRFGVFESIPNLLSRAPMEVLFGTGYQSISGLLASGEITGISGLTVLDQEFTRQLAGAGVIGLGILIWVIISGLKRGDFLSRLLILYMVVFFLSFDFLSWRMLFVLFIVAVSGPADRGWTDRHMKFDLLIPEEVPIPHPSTKIQGLKNV